MPKQQSGQSLPLLKTKLTPPLSGRSLVPRVRLGEWMKAADRAKLVLVRAPAGFGKTTLLVQWMERLKQQQEVTAWLSLDAADNDPDRFLTYLVAALQKGIPALGLQDWVVGPYGGGDPNVRVPYLLDQLSAYEGPLTLFLDDLGAIANPEVLDLVRQLLLYLPPEKKLIIAMRELPELGLGRLRAQGELFDIDVEGMRFISEETEQFVRQTQGLELDAKKLAFLQSSTEGWVAGLQLSTLSQSWRENPEGYLKPFTGTFPKIAEYLAEDVLTRQPQEVQDFLLQTSILNRLSGSLCKAVTGREDAYEVLDYLEQANLFLSPLDEERHWYRYHSIFGKFLRNRLERGRRGRLEQLHRAALEWYAGEGDYQEAAEHAMAAGDVGRAAQLMEQGAMDLFKAGQLTTLGTWGERFSLEVLDRYPMLQLTYCYGLVMLRQYEKAAEIIDRLDREENRMRIDETFSGELSAIRAIVLVAMDKMEDCQKVIADALSKIGEQKLPIGGGSLHNGMALLKINENCFVEAQELLGEGARRIRKTGSKVTWLYNKYLEAYIELAQGRMFAAEEQLRAALEDVGSFAASFTHGGAIVAVKLAEILYERDELDEAEKFLVQYRAMLPNSYPVDICITGLRTLARIHYAREDKLQVERLLTDIERYGAEIGIPRVGASARLEKMRVALQRGDLNRALDIVKGHDDRKVWKDLHGRCPLANDQETYEIGRLRLMVARGQGREALELLKAELKRAQTAHRFRQALQLRILIARALEACGQRKSALRALREAVLLAHDEGFIRSFADQGRSFLPLIHELHKITLASVESAGEAVSIAFLDRILQAMGEQNLALSVAEETLDSGPIAPFTDREIEIIEKVALGFSNEELTEQLSISINTVRFHLRNIYSKLGVNSRTKAVALARRHGLIK